MCVYTRTHTYTNTHIHSYTHTHTHTHTHVDTHTHTHTPVDVVLTEAGVLGEETLAQHRAEGSKQCLLVLRGDGRARYRERERAI